MENSGDLTGNRSLNIVAIAPCFSTPAKLAQNFLLKNFDFRSQFSSIPVKIYQNILRKSVAFPTLFLCIYCTKLEPISKIGN